MWNGLLDKCLELKKIKETEINIFKAMINFAKNDEFLTIIITVPFIFELRYKYEELKNLFHMTNRGVTVVVIK